MALTIAKHHMIEFKEYFGDPALSRDVQNPNKMLYDVVRILGLRIMADLNQSLIKLSKAPGDAQIKHEIVIHLASLCYN